MEAGGAGDAGGAGGAGAAASWNRPEAHWTLLEPFFETRWSV